MCMLARNTADDLPNVVPQLIEQRPGVMFVAEAFQPKVEEYVRQANQLSPLEAVYDMWTTPYVDVAATTMSC